MTEVEVDWITCPRCRIVQPLGQDSGAGCHACRPTA
jgi:hypothetical protein